jgi:hypothetical protein
MDPEPFTPSSNFFYYFYLFLVLIILLRFIRSVYGTKVSITRFIQTSIVYVIIAALALFGSYEVGVAPIYFFADPVIAIASGLFAQRVMEQRLVFWRTSDGSVYYKGGSLLILVYAALLSLRVAVEYYYVGNLFFSGGFSYDVSQNGVLASIVVDALLMISMGLLIGRNVLVIRTYDAIRREKLDVPMKQ